MPDWLIERGIGETRFARIKDDRIVEARILVDGIVPAGTRLTGKLKRSGVQLFAVADGQDYLLPDGAHGITEGRSLTIEVTREVVPGAESWKRPLAKVIDGTVRIEDRIVGREIAFPSTQNGLSQAGWDDVIEEARSGIVRFEGGELRLFPTPAMTLIDVDGTLPPPDLARRAACEATKSVLRLGIGGSIGIDFPTVTGKAARTEVDRAIDFGLPAPFERTSLNGFGFLQVVRPRRHASLLELALDRPSFEARALLRRAASDSAGPKRLAGHPAVIRILEQNPHWTAALARQVGGAVTLRADASLPIHGAYAENA